MEQSDLDMQARGKRGEGCWTCRIRRKKCDENRPVCGECGALEIACHYQNTKPPWMDGGPSQAEMREHIKAEIKWGAARRRARHHIESLSKGRDDENTFMNVIRTRTRRLKSRTPSTPIASPLEIPSLTHSHDGNSDTGASTPNPATFTSGSPVARIPEVPNESGPYITSPSSDLVTPSPVPALVDDEAQFLIMTYLDFVLPTMFPLYKPRLLDGGRVWMLSLITKNKALYHIALSLSSYLFSVELATENPGHDDCKMRSWEKLQQQMEAAFQAISRDLQQISQEGMEDSLLHNVGLMGSIIQLLNVEVVMARSEDWRVHLDAAMRIFERLFQKHSMVDGEPRLPTILAKVGWCVWDGNSPRPTNRAIWTSEQASLLFFTSLLLVHDVLGSTSLGEAPRLQAYHHALLDAVDVSDAESSISLENLIGCENWVMILIGEIAALVAWKTQCKRQCRLSMMELAKKAHDIESRLNAGITRVEAPASTGRPPTTVPVDIMARYSPQQGKSDSRLFTLIWAYAALAYLHVTVSGRQLHSPELRQSVARTIDLLRALPNPAWLRATVWPFCLAGCLARLDEEQVLRDLVSNAGPLWGFGGLQTALKLMEKVWSLREEANAMDWDLSACFSILGYPAFLV